MTKILSALLFVLTTAVSPARAEGRRMPPLQGIAGWLNTEKPLAPEDLKGKVVLVDFWTYSCINCIRTLPHVESWHEKYADQGLVVIGVHTPEFDFEKDEKNVKAAVAKFGVKYPVALDSDMKTWDAYGNQYWPAHYLVDRRGNIRETHAGEGNYEETERKIVELLAEGGPAPAPAKASVPVETPHVMTPEIYLGSARLDNFGNAETVRPGERQSFRAPPSPDFNRFVLDGEWRLEPEFAALESGGGRIVIRYEADKANMVLEAKGPGLDVEVMVDGAPATAGNKGGDVVISGGKALCRVAEPRLYNLARTPDGKRHVLEIRVPTGGLLAYTFTFG